MVNDVIIPSGCEARAINLGNKNMKIGIFSDGTSVQSKNIFTDNSRYPTRKHEIKSFMIRVLKNVIEQAFGELYNVFQDDFDELYHNSQRISKAILYMKQGLLCDKL